MKENEVESMIHLENVSKSFNVYYDKTNSIKEKIVYVLKSKKREKRQILKDINLDIKRESL